MSEPLDFTAVGSPKSAPPQKHRPRRLGRSRSPSIRVVVPVLAVVLAVAAFAVLRDDGSSSPGDTANTDDPRCAAASAFDLLAPNPAANPAPEAASAATLAIRIETIRGAGAKLKAVAPAELRVDVDAVVGAISRAAEGDATAIQSNAFRDARQRIATFRAASCPDAGAVSGD